MKKISILILGLLSIAIGTYYFLFSSILPTKNVNHISITSYISDSMTVYGNETADTLSTTIETINKGQHRDEPIQFTPEYTLEIGYTDRESQTVEMDFDTDKKEVLMYLPTTDKFYTLNETSAEFFMIDKEFKDIYPNSQVPQGQISKGDTSIYFDTIESNWSYKQVDNTWATIESATASTEASIIASKGSDVYQIYYDLPPTSTELLIRDGESILYEETLTDGRFMPLSKEGQYTYEFTSYWDNDDYRGSIKSSVNIEVDLPARFRLARNTATAGDFFTIYADFINADEEIFLNQNILPNNPSFFDVDGTKIAFIPLNYYAKTGNYKITAYTNKPETNSEHATTFDVKINYKNFKKQYLYVDETIEKSTRNDDAYTQYNRYFKPARDTISSEKLWSGPFIAPVEGRISTEFGEMRYVNDALTSYRHSGTDYAVPKGTPIKAPNNGRVNLSMFLTLTGNTIVIDHGLGLFTVYFHLDSLSVEKDQMVSQGDIIGTVGSTGFSTGPHLHYTTSIGKTNFDSLILSGMDPLNP